MPRAGLIVPLWWLSTGLGWSGGRCVISTKGSTMKNSEIAKSRAVKAVILLSMFGLGSLLSACVVAEPREGYWDREHARWYHNHGWVGCGREDEHCR
jgi:hypothetical protein